MTPERMRPMKIPTSLRPYADRDLPFTLSDRWARQCDYKRRYSLRARAERVAEQMANVMREPFNAYACDCCGVWHVGHAKKGFERDLKGEE